MCAKKADPQENCSVPQTEARIEINCECSALKHCKYKQGRLGAIRSGTAVGVPLSDKMIPNDDTPKRSNRIPDRAHMR